MAKRFFGDNFAIVFFVLFGFSLVVSFMGYGPSASGMFIFVPIYLCFFLYRTDSDRKLFAGGAKSVCFRPGLIMHEREIYLAVLASARALSGSTTGLYRSVITN